MATPIAAQWSVNTGTEMRNFSLPRNEIEKPGQRLAIEFRTACLHVDRDADARLLR